jgi:hypothetical protein
MAKTVLAQLIDIKETIKSGWCRHVYAIDSNGNMCSPNNPHACMWCLTGAVEKQAYWNYARIRSLEAKLCTQLKKVQRMSKTTTASARSLLQKFNDNKATTKRQVLGVIDRAINAERKRVKK